MHTRVGTTFVVQCTLISRIRSWYVSSPDHTDTVVSQVFHLQSHLRAHEIKP